MSTESTQRFLIVGTVVRRGLTNLAGRIVIIVTCCGKGKDNHSLLVRRHFGCRAVLLPALSSLALSSSYGQEMVTENSNVLCVEESVCVSFFVNTYLFL